MQTSYTTSTVHNEIELCEINSLECKQLIEKEFLKNHISYYVRWPKPSFFGRKKDLCIICVHEDVKEAAETIVRSICDEAGYSVKFLMKRSVNHFL
ncbi:MAG: hypothetical protein IKL04_07760 [Lachnospiraceae bacterium]|nr:hypothetical protein [Lachnospiraceae bacterium]